MKRPPFAISLFSLTILLAVSIRCTQQKPVERKIDKYKVEEEWDKLPNTTAHAPSEKMDFDEIAIETDLGKLAAVIAGNNHVNNKAVGYAGEYTAAYACYERIQQIASDKELLTLLQHKAPAVRVYALFALKKRKSNLYEEARKLLFNDNAEVVELSGCDGRITRVSYYAISEPEPF